MPDAEPFSKHLLNMCQSPDQVCMWAKDEEKENQSSTVLNEINKKQKDR